MHCNKCNNPVLEGASFCGKCGNPITIVPKETIVENRPAKKQYTKENWVGFVFGMSLGWAIIASLIPFILCILLGTWFTRKMLRSEKVFVRVIFWITFVLIFIIGIIVHGIKSESQYSTFRQNAGVEDFSLIETDKSTVNSQTLGNMYRNTKYNFRIKFPEGWKIEIGDGIHVVQKASNGDSTISVIIQQLELSGMDGFVSIKDAGTAKEFIDATVEGISAKFSNVKIIDYGETKIDNQTAYWVEYSSTSQILDNRFDMTSLNYFLAKGDTMYTISAGTASAGYSAIKPLFIESVGTFVFENN